MKAIGSGDANSYVLVAYSGSQGASGLVSATRIFDDLSRRNVWYTTRRAKGLNSGCTLIFYQAGLGITGYATVVEVSDNDRIDNEVLQNFGLYHLRFKIRLSNVIRFSVAVKLGPIVSDLDFITNKKYWGHSLRATPRSISAADFQKILDMAPHK